MSQHTRLMHAGFLIGLPLKDAVTMRLVLWSQQLLLLTRQLSAALGQCLSWQCSAAPRWQPATRSRRFSSNTATFRMAHFSMPRKPIRMQALVVITCDHLQSYIKMVTMIQNESRFRVQLVARVKSTPQFTSRGCKGCSFHTTRPCKLLHNTIKDFCNRNSP